MVEVMVGVIRDYDCAIHYHPGKGNVVADVLSWKSMSTLFHVSLEKVKISFRLP